MNNKTLAAALSIRFPLAPPQVAQAAVLDTISLRTFKKKAWSLDTLPDGFWDEADRSTADAQVLLETQGLKTLRRFVFDDLPLQVVATALTSTETIKALLAAIGHDHNCTTCPLHTSDSVILDVVKAFRIYLGARQSLSDDPELGYFRLKPWLGRHLVVLAECGLKAIRPPDVIETKKRSSKENEEAERSKQQRKRRKKATLQDLTNLPAAPPSPLRNVLDSSLSLSPTSCKQRRKERAMKVREARARSWAARPEAPDSEDTILAVPDSTVPATAGPSTYAQSTPTVPVSTVPVPSASLGKFRILLLPTTTISPLCLLPASSNVHKNLHPRPVVIRLRTYVPVHRTIRIDSDMEGGHRRLRGTATNSALGRGQVSRCSAPDCSKTPFHGLILHHSTFLGSKYDYEPGKHQGTPYMNRLRPVMVTTGNAVRTRAAANGPIGYQEGRTGVEGRFHGALRPTALRRRVERRVSQHASARRCYDVTSSRFRSSTNREASTITNPPVKVYIYESTPTRHGDHWERRPNPRRSQWAHRIPGGAHRRLVGALAYLRASYLASQGVEGRFHGALRPTALRRRVERWVSHHASALRCYDVTCFRLRSSTNSIRRHREGGEDGGGSVVSRPLLWVGSFVGEEFPCKVGHLVLRCRRAWAYW
ncbi:hypothetical protein B0H13DRAFT_2322189 [Mycena leptocephala]|nr:hypothetical protein B0H13DRAFT_2322189 [Mycena leptocephala]